MKNDEFDQSTVDSGQSLVVSQQSTVESRKSKVESRKSERTHLMYITNAAVSFSTSQPLNF